MNYGRGKWIYLNVFPSSPGPFSHGEKGSVWVGFLTRAAHRAIKLSPLRGFMFLFYFCYKAAAPTGLNSFPTKSPQRGRKLYRNNDGNIVKPQRGGSFIKSPFN
jgi:hypothetical protein